MDKNFDHFLNEYYEEIQKTIEKFKGKNLKYNDLIERVKQNIQDKQTNKEQQENPQPVDDNINHQKNKIMNFGQSNLKEATKYSQYYKYKVHVASHKNYDMHNYVFMIDNAIMKKLFNKVEDRFTYKSDNVSLRSVIFKYNPKSSRKMMDDGTIVNFEPFEISVTTHNCYDFVYYHCPNNGQNKEVLKCIYVLNMEKVEARLDESLADTYISDNGKENMKRSLYKHLSNVQSPERYGVDGDMYEEIVGMIENEAIMIVDDYEDGELLSSLGEYIT